MGQDPAVIREEIEQTREHMGDTVDALGYKADVPSRAKEAVSDKVETLKSKVSGVGGQVSDAVSGVGGQVSDATPDAHEVKAGVRRAAGVAQENPLGLAIGAAAVGFLVGSLVPSTKVEDERIGPAAEQVKERVKETGEEALEHGKQVARETAEKAQQAAAEVGQAASESAQSHAQEVADSAKEPLPGAAS